MRIWVSFWLVILSLSTGSAALKSEGKTHLQVLQGQKSASIKVDKGFHFNLEAPKYLLNNQNKIAPSAATEAKLEFKWAEDLKPNAKIHYYVCDDAKTVCEPHSHTLNPQILENKKTAQGADKSTLASTKVTRDNEGFILNNFEVAKRQAAKKNTLLLIDFTASWCPACIRLIHETFAANSFKKISQKYVLLKVDVDLEENQELLEQFSIHAFPSLVLVDAKGDEIERFLDYIPSETLVPALEKLATGRLESLKQLKAKATKGNVAARTSLGINAFKAQKTSECLDWLEPLSIKPIEYYFCSIEKAQEDASNSNSENTTALEVALQKALEAFPQSFYSIDWRLQLAEIRKKQPKKQDYEKLLAEAKQLGRDWLDNPTKLQNANKNGELLELQGLVLPEVHFVLGKIAEDLGDKKEAQKEYEHSVELTMSLNPSAKNPTIVLYLVQYLKKIHSYEKPLEWLKKLEEGYPQEFTYLHRQASLLNENKKFQEALPLAEKAHALAYGKNQVRTGLLLAKVQTELNNKKEAQTILQNLLKTSAVQAPGSTQSREKIMRALKEFGAN
ncbi:MAG: hypothetical protein RJB66_2047 [Pseudomonadota bacterium]|jgi:thioredoxin-related protein